uniref:PsbP C-terminal domain-containing protein n=1 Tax=Pyramimonas obovata TaxID=1411642 RepID=A0A7S0RA50_9CHLO|mmetsp:Transcript_29406/g.64245  ORF Transcript_29406/g.64245 Transcript_29406/m.64245 type:complete len:283 (+) Transcript_29406:56-904(+)|eukprot:CAMPEP_0118933680 /NCGR_PEP_ID=MMETSP1169-20130426/12120_1 /TAXON_ID=36882 /ORGANISM="Pyramimonas obovata, Strain CCMP722" /LENGTH=282 /DNA_ID=CAMNT_0006876473 /DNA_START=49 /DNA_END=897 /DNA_ORIENTATION=-
MALVNVLSVPRAVSSRSCTFAGNDAIATPVASKAQRCAIPRQQAVVRMSQEPAFRRRDALAMPAAAAALTALELPQSALAVQGLTAGRIPGLTPSDSLEGFNYYKRPAGKSGGHGVGWSEIPPYSFNVPEGWEEVAVSIADLGGAEVDLRFNYKPEGDLAVVVAPVLRFYDVGYNASVIIEDLGTPEKIIKAFGPEILGRPVEDEDILYMDTKKDKGTGLTYYMFDVKPHYLIAATAFKNRLFIMTVRASSTQWRKSKDKLMEIRDSFAVTTENDVDFVKSG